MGTFINGEEDYYTSTEDILFHVFLQLSSLDDIESLGLKRVPMDYWDALEQVQAKGGDELVTIFEKEIDKMGYISAPQYFNFVGPSGQFDTRSDYEKLRIRYMHQQRIEIAESVEMLDETVEPILENTYTKIYDRLRIQVTDYMQYGEPSGAIIVNVAENFPGRHQRPQVGDIILSMEGTDIYTGLEGLHVLQSLPSSQDEALLTVLRNDDEVVIIPVELSESSFSIRWLHPVSGICGLSVTDGGGLVGLIYSAPLKYLLYLLDQGTDEVRAEFEAASASDEPRVIHTLTPTPWCMDTHTVYVRHDLLRDQPDAVLEQLIEVAERFGTWEGKDIFINVYWVRD